MSSHLKSATQSAASRATKAANAAISRFIAQNSSISSFLEWVSEVTAPSCAQTMSSAEESVTVTVHAHSPLTDEIESLVLAYGGDDRLVGYRGEEMKLLRIGEVDCFFIADGKTCAAAADGKIYQLRMRLCEVEARLPDAFVKINRSAVGQLSRIERFIGTFAGGVDARFYGGHRG